MPIVDLPDGREIEFPDDVTPDQMTSALRTDFPSFFSTPEPPTPSFTQDQIGDAFQAKQPPTPFDRNWSLTPNFSGDNSTPNRAEYVMNVARSIPADLGAAAMMFERDKSQPMTLLPSPTRVAETVKKNLPYAAQASGNIPAAVAQQPLPIDREITEAAQESVGAATVARLSQDLAGTAPLAVVGLLPAAAVRLATAGFTADMLAHAPELFNQYAEEINKPKEEQDPNRLATLQSGILQTFTMAPTAGAHGFGKPAAEIVAQVRTAFDNANRLAPTTKGAPDASRITEAEKLHADVPAQPIQVQQAVPVKESGQGVQPPVTAPEVAPAVAEAKPLNPGGPVSELPPDLKAIEAANAAKQKAIADEFKKSLENREAQPAAEPPTPSPVSAEAALPTAPASEVKSSVTPEVTPNKPGEMIGMGGAVPAEFHPKAGTPTSIKNAQVEKERAARGLPPAIEPARRSFGRVWDEAMAKIDQDPLYQGRLISELREKPRSLTDHEDAVLLDRQITLQNEYDKATLDLAQAADDAKTFPNRLDAVESEKARVAAVRDQLYDLYEIGKKVGTETGRGLNARKMMALEDYTLAKMEMEKRSVNDGNPLTEKQQSEVAELHKRIAETQKRFDEYVAKTDAREAELAMQAALKKVEAEAKKEPVVHPRIIQEAERIVGFMEKAADSARERLKKKFASTSAGVDPTIIADLSIVGAAKIARNVVDFAKWSDLMVKEIGEGIRPYLGDAFRASQERFNNDIDRMAKGSAPKVKRTIAKTDLAERKAEVGEQIKARMTSTERQVITPFLQKLARLFVQEGINTRDALIDAVHGVLKEFDPEFTRRETMDAISGYGDFRQLSKDEISIKLRDLKGQMQQVAKLEDMQAKQPPLKTGMERRIPSDEERRLIALVNKAKNEFQIPIDDPNTQLKSSLDELKTRLKNRTADFERMLAKKEFTTKPRRIIQMDEEANKLHFAMSKAKADWHKALMEDRLAKRSTARKIFDTGVETSNLSRAVLASTDLSGVLRQGGFITMAHPIRSAKSLPAMFKAFRSEAGQHAVNQEIAARKNFPLYNQAKLYLSEHGQKLSQMEEAYMSRWADKIPLVAGSQRAYVTFLNKLRADSFDAMANALSKGGELTPAEANAIANFINVATGRGNLGMKENALVGLNTIFFAPRYVASRFQLLAGQPLYRGTARTRAAIAKEYARYMAGVGLVYGLAAMDGAEIESDPRSSDFGKLKYGNTRLDPISGLAQTSTLIGRLASGETKKLSGQVVPIRGKVPYGSPNSADVMANFARSKLAPMPGAIVNVLTGKDVVGQPVTAQSTAQGLLVPLSFPEIAQAMEEQGIPRGTAFSILSIFGMGLQNYEQQVKKN